MKASNYIIPTTKEDPSDAVVASHKLMIRAGLARKVSSGLYSYLPLGLRTLKKIENIVREEMNSASALEFELPILTPAELWELSGRWTKMGKEMFRQKDRHEQDYALGPTHEETFTSLMKPILKSYKDLPRNVYQIHTKFRDEIRPRFGVIRSREFTMKDAYSFHLDDACLDKTYQQMRQTYRNIFHRCGLETIPVQADSGAMGGSGSEEFMVVSPIGEESLAICPSCGYRSNVEKTPLLSETKSGQPEASSPEVVDTPGTKTIEEVAKFLGKTPADTIKAVMLKGDEEKNFILFIRGDREVNEAKLKSLTACTELRPLSTKECEKLSLVPGYTGPGIKVSEDFIVYIDNSIQPGKGYIAGANEIDKHVKNFVISRDSVFKDYKDFALVIENDPCPECKKALKIEKGIEVGHIFKLGKKYTEAFEFTVSDKNGRNAVPTMGCYGIGVNRTMATIIEQGNDEKGIIWPISVAPFEVSLVSILKKEEELKIVDEVYEFLQQNGVDVLYDDRNLSPGFKLRDSEIIGIPIRVVFGKKFSESQEYALAVRRENTEKNIPFTSKEDLLKEILKVRQELYAELSV